MAEPFVRQVETKAGDRILDFFPSWRLPKLDAVAFTVNDPREVSKTFIVAALRDDLHAVGGELFEQPVKIVDTKINHRLLRSRTEVRCVRVKGGPNGTCVRIRVVGPV